MPVTKIHSHWSGGDLIFHEALASRPAALYNVLTIGDDGVTVGSATNDIDFKVFLGASDQYAEFNYGTYQLNFSKSSIEMTGALPAEGLASPYIGIGTSASSIEISTFADNVVGIGTWFKLKKSAAKSLLGAYFKVETDGATEAPLSQLVAVAPRVTVDMNLDSAYGVQSHMTVSGAKTSSELISVSAYVNLGTGQRTADRVCALQAMFDGSGTAGTVSGDAFVAYIVNGGTVITTDSIVNIRNQSAATAVSAVELEIDGTVTYAFDFQGTVSDGWTSSDETGEFGAFDECVLIPVRVKGVAETLYLMAAHTWQSVD